MIRYGVSIPLAKAISVSDDKGINPHNPQRGIILIWLALLPMTSDEGSEGEILVRYLPTGGTYPSSSPSASDPESYSD